MSATLTRRGLLGGVAAGSGLLLSGCDKLGQNEQFRDILKLGEDANYVVHRGLQDRMALAKEFAPNQRSPIFRSNGTRLPVGDTYARHIATEFRDWTLVVDGLVAKPQILPINQLRAMPARTQITRHDCVEGWSAIAKWTGVPVKLLLDRASLRPEARYIVFHCADANDGTPYYESFDLLDAYHPQTILAWNLNDQALPVTNGAPLRLRVERQLGYKHAKFVQRIEAVASLKSVYDG
ncbi:MAG: molybdopterin-dependent oxidoreductase, partial [Sphingomonas sp.]